MYFWAGVYPLKKHLLFRGCEHRICVHSVNTNSLFCGLQKTSILGKLKSTTITFVQRKNWNLHRWLSQNEGCLFRISWLVVVYAWKLNLSFCEISKRQRATQLNTRLSWCPFLYYKRSFNINIFTACWPIYQQAEFISRNMLPVLAWIIRRFH